MKAGVGIGLALALAGVLVGTATGTATPFQQVVVVNGLASPIPVTGTVTGTVGVGNFPANQQVSGTVDLGTTDSGHLANIDSATSKLTFDGNGNLKMVSTPAIATKFYSNFFLAYSGSDNLDLGGTINATSIVLNHIGGSAESVKFSLGSQRRLTLFQGDADVVVPLPAAIPIDGVQVGCSNYPCEIWLSIAGF